MKPVRFRSQQLGFTLPQPISEMSLEELWHWHNLGLRYWRDQTLAEGNVSWLEIKQALAEKLLQACNFCVHDCQVNRQQNELGYCRLNVHSPISGSYLHWGEEAPINPTWAVFFSGCTMHCVYCHNWRETFEFQRDQSLNIPALMAELKQRQGDYRTLSLIGGTPEPHLHTVIELARALPSEIDIPLVFNNNATLSGTGLALMEGVVDIYLPDFKHGNNQCAWKLTRISHYLETVKANLNAYREQKRGVLIRHLVVPGHLECCTRPVLDTLAQDYPQFTVNVMFQYRPMYLAENKPELARSLSVKEVETVNQWLQELQLRQVS